MKRSKRWTKAYYEAKKQVADEIGVRYMLRWDDDFIDFLVRRKMVENYKSKNKQLAE